MKAIATKFDGSSTYSADEFNPNMTELENAVKTSGQSLNEVNLNQLGEAMSRYSSGGGLFYNEGGSGNAFVLTAPSTFIMPKGYFDGMLVMCRAGFSATGACTINVSTIGAVALVDPTGNAIGNNYIRSGDTFLAMYNAVNSHFRIIHISRIVPYSAIVLFSGAIVDIPTGWQLCDGTSGTPDLTDQFVIGAGDTFAPDDAGGSNLTGSHVLTVDEIPPHSHSQVVNNVAPRSGGGVNGGSFLTTQQTGLTGGGLGHTHTMTPPYYALAYIMKL